MAWAHDLKQLRALSVSLGPRNEAKVGPRVRAVETGFVENCRAKPCNASPWRTGEEMIAVLSNVVEIRSRHCWRWSQKKIKAVVRSRTGALSDLNQQFFTFARKDGMETRVTSVLRNRASNQSFGSSLNATLRAQSFRFEMNFSDYPVGISEGPTWVLHCSGSFQPESYTTMVVIYEDETTCKPQKLLSSLYINCELNR